MGVVNYMERVVEDVLEQQWEHLHLKCSCEVCKNDILALTLNRVPTRYVSNDKGRLIVQATMMEEQLLADVLREIARAVLVVSEKPSHELPDASEATAR
ncbi:MAG TPA: late competence development ComFB family protein [Bacilli bacterium]|nr:late competence development ComFB family protein [Bacilli bacterium]